MPVHVLGLAASPRRRGNTSLLLERALAGAEDAGAHVERVELCRLRIAPCRACDRCHQTGLCAVHDDYQALLDRLVAADAIALASPLYFLGVSGWAKAFIDRGQCLWARKHIVRQPLPPTSSGRPRRAAFLAVGGTPHAPFKGAVATVRAWLDTLDAIYLGDVLRSGVDAPGAIRNDPAALDEAYRLGRSLAHGPQPGGQ
jgi:multimeric flavodoxin WrbA